MNNKEGNMQTYTGKQHELNEAIASKAHVVEIDRLRAVNAELVAALRGYMQSFTPDFVLLNASDRALREQARAALAKAEV